MSSSSTSKRLLLAPGRLHFICIGIALLGTIPLLWPDLGNEEVQETLAAYSGIVIMGAFFASVVLMVITCTSLALRLRNLRALWQMCLWVFQWAIGWGVFCVFAIMANVPPLHERETAEPIQQTDTLFSADEQITGPAALTLAISLDQATADELVSAPNMTLLENDHEEIFDKFLTTSPRWASELTDATFYARPGHVVAEPANSGSAIGLVHVAFLSLVEGEQLPTGYVILRPGAPFPEQTEGKTSTPDIALELGRRHYLLLAWRGSGHGETARKAINATISAVDEQLKPLAQNPTEECVANMIQGIRNSTGSTPELRLCEVPTQYGTYQAEIHVNPGKAGTLFLLIKDLESGQSLRLFNCPALYSDNENELFRHDIPGSIPSWMRQASLHGLGDLFPAISPIFAIRRGPTHHYFGVAFEVWFNPEDSTQARTLLLRRCYKVQAFEEAPKAPEPHQHRETEIGE